MTEADRLAAMADQMKPGIQRGLAWGHIIRRNYAAARACLHRCQEVTAAAATAGGDTHTQEKK